MKDYSISTMKFFKIVWTFNPPTAGVVGRFFERLIGSTKSLLRRMIGRSKLSLDELPNCLSGVAATINDRPFTLTGFEKDDLIPLNPNMFLKGEAITQFPEVADSLALSKSYKKMKETQHSLQARFRKEYLAELVMRKGKLEVRSIRVGDVALIGSDNRKMFEWPLGQIV